MNRITMEFHDGEPIFILRGQDALAPQVVDLWALSASMLHTDSKKVKSAHKVADEMRKWQKANPDKTKIPD